MPPRAPLLVFVIAAGFLRVLLAQGAAPAAADGIVHGYVLGPLAEPVTAADVWVEDAFGEVAARGATDGEGYFVLAGLPRGRDVVVRATAPGLQIGAAASLQPVRKRGELAPPCWIRLYEAAVLEGRVVDANHAPIVGATIVGWNTIRGSVPEYEAIEALTDAEGRFRLAKLAAGDTTFAVWGEGFLPQRYVVRDDARLGGDYAVVPGTGPQLRLEVSGVPKERAGHVEIAFGARGGAGPPPRAYRRGVLSADGSFTSKPFGPGTRFADVRIRADRIEFDRPWIPDVPPRTTVEVAAVDLVPARIVAGVTLGGTPEAGQQIEITNETRAEVVDLCTDAAGRFRCEAPWHAADLLRVRLVRSRAFLEPEGVWSGTVRDLRGALLHGARGRDVRIRLLTAGDKQPLPRTAVRVELAQGPQGARSVDAVTDDRGLAEWFGIPVGARGDDLRIVVATPRYEATADVEAEQAEPQVVVARHASALHGRVTNAGGSPLAHRDVLLFTANPWERFADRVFVAATRTDSRGRYRFVGLRYGHHMLEISGSGTPRCGTEPFEVGDARTTEHDVSLR